MKLWEGKSRILSVVVLMLCAAIARANTEYYRHTTFDNSLTSDGYFYSFAMANGHSFVEEVNSRLPVENCSVNNIFSQRIFRPTITIIEQHAMLGSL